MGVEMITIDVDELDIQLHVVKTDDTIEWTVDVDDFLDENLEIIGELKFTDQEIMVYYEGYGITVNADITVTDTLFGAKKVEVYINNPQLLDDELTDLLEGVDI
jgi:hypothetical protein